MKRLSQQERDLRVVNDAIRKVQEVVHTDGTTTSFFLPGATSANLTLNYDGFSSFTIPIGIAGGVYVSGGTSASAGPFWLTFDSGTAAADRSIGGVEFQGKNNASTGTQYIRLVASTPNVTAGTEDAKLTFFVLGGGAEKSLLTLDGTGPRVTINGSTATPAGGTTGLGLTFGTTTNFGIFYGSGAPSLSADKGSLYLRSDGSSTSTRAYINTDGGTTWTSITTAA
jgi:hypothetical protein